LYFIIFVVVVVIFVVVVVIFVVIDVIFVVVEKEVVNIRINELARAVVLNLF